MQTTHLNPVYREIVRKLELLPVRDRYTASASIFKRSKVRFGETLTSTFRSSLKISTRAWDPWLFKDGDLYRLFYLTGPEGLTPWWRYSQINGAISTDLLNWQDIGTIVEPNRANQWESGRIFAGTTYKENGVFYLFYSAAGHKDSELNIEGIGLATSLDGLHWQRHSGQYLLRPEPDNEWYGYSVESQHLHWRDPYLVKDPQTGKYYMFICAFAKGLIDSEFQGCVALAVADQITGPYQMLPPVVAPTADTVRDWPFHHTERPQVIYRQGKYHLFFSCFTHFINPNWLKKVETKNITDSSLYWFTSDRITGPFTPVSDKPIVRGSDRTSLYGANFFSPSDQAESLYAYGWYYRLYALETFPVFQAVWDGDEIMLKPSVHKTL
jgi:beta-fructofuranosidase